LPHLHGDRQICAICHDDRGADGFGEALVRLHATPETLLFQELPRHIARGLEPDFTKIMS
jgi:cytochrome c553